MNDASFGGTMAKLFEVADAAPIPGKARARGTRRSRTCSLHEARRAPSHLDSAEGLGSLLELLTMTQDTLDSCRR